MNECMQMSARANADLVNIPLSSLFLTVQRTASVLPLCAFTAAILWRRRSRLLSSPVAL